MGNKIVHLLQSVSDGIRAANPQISSSNPMIGTDQIPTNQIQAQLVTCPHDAGTYETTSVVPISTIYRIKIDVTEAYDGAATMTIGKAGSLNCLLDTGDINLLATGLTTYEFVESWTTSEKVVITVGGAATVGACTISVEYFV